MPSLISAQICQVSGWVKLSFPKDDAIRKLIKTIPGVIWGPYQGVPPGPWKGTARDCPPNAKCWSDKNMKAGDLPTYDDWVDCKSSSHRAWFVPWHGWGLLKPLLEKKGNRINETRDEVARQITIVPQMLSSTLRPYQVETAETMMRVRRHLCAFDPRVGKTRTAIASACGMFAAKQIDIAIVLYPASVRAEWEGQLLDFAKARLEILETRKLFDDEEIEELRSRRFLFVGCHYDILSEREPDIGRLVEGRRFAMIIDECQMLQNRRIGRTQAVQRLSRSLPLTHKGDLPEENIFAEQARCEAVWLLSGTPMRNKPTNLWAAFDIMHPGSMGSYWNYAKRYANAHQDEMGHWDDSGESNPEELRARLAAVWTRKTRREVAPWLPKSQRAPIVCNAVPDQLKRYRALERQYGSRVLKALERDEPTNAERNLIETLARATTEAKIPTGIERMINVHAATGNKVLGFAHHHETLRAMEAEADKQRADRMSAGLSSPSIFVAGGWMNPDERREVIEAWKASKDDNGFGGILLANSKSSGVGIDLSPALVTCFFEYEYVPADFRQAEDRNQDIHKGTHAGLARLYEYLMVPGTVDEAMILALLRKIGSIGRIVGLDEELAGMSSALRQSGVIDDGRLGLSNNDKETIKAAMDSIRDRLLRGGDDEEDENESLAAEASELEDEAEDSPDDDIPF